MTQNYSICTEEHVYWISFACNYSAFDFFFTYYVQLLSADYDDLFLQKEIEVEVYHPRAGLFFYRTRIGSL
jgi:hypothetical protein